MQNILTSWCHAIRDVHGLHRTSLGTSPSFSDIFPKGSHFFWCFSLKKALLWQISQLLHPPLGHADFSAVVRCNGLPKWRLWNWMGWFATPRCLDVVDERCWIGMNTCGQTSWPSRVWVMFFRHINLEVGSLSVASLFGSRYFNQLHVIFRLYELRCLPWVSC